SSTMSRYSATTPIPPSGTRSRSDADHGGGGRRPQRRHRPRRGSSLAPARGSAPVQGHDDGSRPGHGPQDVRVDREGPARPHHHRRHSPARLARPGGGAGGAERGGGPAAGGGPR